MKTLTKIKGLEEELTELGRLEQEISKLKGDKREEAMKTYRELLWLLRDEPIYLLRYE